eukprot:TRINITY_DN1729_c0_g1_i2.p2 TRINITY_DN1729_c0_g1~~TRINITY_DN1729_c0_g1_i2.p2  ORF type:complete len:174 (+),score=46.18 TRINITY_DN1729_c0_g1_i2:518-1039(+)
MTHRKHHADHSSPHHYAEKRPLMVHNVALARRPSVMTADVQTAKKPAGSGFKFGGTTTTSKPSVDKDSKAASNDTVDKGDNVDKPAKGFKFGGQSNSSAASTKPAGFKFGGASKPKTTGFKFGSAGKKRAAEDDDEEEDEGEASTADPGDGTQMGKPEGKAERVTKRAKRKKN